MSTQNIWVFLRNKKNINNFLDKKKTKKKKKNLAGAMHIYPKYSNRQT